MKIDYRKIIAYWILLMWSICTTLWLTSCSTPNVRLQKKHYDKFIYYGGKIDTVEKVVTKEILVKGKDGKDSLIYVDVLVDCPEAKIEYKDRWHIRRMDKAERDSLEHVERMAKIKAKLTIDSLNKVIKIERQKKGQKRHDAKKEKRKSYWPFWMAIAIVVLLIVILLRFK